MAAETNGDVVWKRNESASEHDETWDDSALIEAYDRAVNQVKEEIAQRNTSTGGGTGTGTGRKKGRRKPKGNQIHSWKVGDYCQAVFSEDGLRYEAFIKEVNQSATSCLVQYLGYGNEEIVSMSGLFPSLGKDARAVQEQNAGTKQTAPKKEAASETSSQRSFPQKGLPKRQSNWRCSSRTSSVRHSHNHPAPSNVGPGPPGDILSWLRTVVPQHGQADSKTQAYTCGYMSPGHFCHAQHQQQQQRTHDHQYHTQVPNHIPPPPFPLDHDLVDNEEALAAMLMSWYMSGYHTGFYQALQQSKSSKHGVGPCCMHVNK